MVKFDNDQWEMRNRECSSWWVINARSDMTMGDPSLPPHHHHVLHDNQPRLVVPFYIVWQTWTNVFIMCHRMENCTLMQCINRSLLWVQQVIKRNSLVFRSPNTSTQKLIIWVPTHYDTSSCDKSNTKSLPDMSQKPFYRFHPMQTSTLYTMN